MKTTHTTVEPTHIICVICALLHVLAYIHKRCVGCGWMESVPGTVVGTWDTYYCRLSVGFYDSAHPGNEKQNASSGSNGKSTRATGRILPESSLQAEMDKL